MKRTSDTSSEDVTSPTGVERMLRKHRDRLCDATKGTAGGAGLTALTGELLTKPLLPWTVAAIATRLPADADVASDGHDFGEWYVAVSVCRELDPPSAAALMSGGYLAHMNAVTAPAWTHPQGRKVAHWIYCCDRDMARVHLTVIPNPQLPRTSPPLVAQDFLSAAERRQLNIISAG